MPLKKTRRPPERPAAPRPVRPLAARAALCSAAAALCCHVPAVAALFALQAACDLAVCLSRLPGGSRPQTPRFRVSAVASPIRESWRSLPGGTWTQRLLTRLSGKPLAGQAAPDVRPLTLLGGAAFELAAGVAVTALAVIAGPPALLLALPGLLLTVHALRFLALTVFHECAHGSFTRDERLDRLIGAALGVVLLGQSFAAYVPEHRGDHHGPGFMSLDDPTVAFLFHVIGLEVGMSRLECWCRLIATALSPWYHVAQTARRLRSSWRGATATHRLLLAAYLTLIAGLAALWPAPVLVAWVLPLTVLTNGSLAVRACFEHCLPPPAGRPRSPESVAASTHAIFFGGPLPGRWRDRPLWAAAMLGYHLPCRLLFCPGTSSAHDGHHAAPLAGVSPDPIYARQELIAGRRPDRPVYTEVWSLHAAIDECFRTVREADPIPLTEKEVA